MADVYALIREVCGITKELPRKSMFSFDMLSWYRGKVKGFHNYRIYNGANYLDLERKSLQMPKFICETWANLLLNERCDIILPDDDKEKLDSILKANNFWLKANDGVEKSFALGLGAFVVNIKGLQVGNNTGLFRKEKAKIKIDFINETKVFPITVEDKEVTECAFVSQNTDTTNIVIHLKDEATGIYKIHNYVIDVKGIKKSYYVFDTKSEIAWFQIIRPNLSSNYITELSDDELAISIYANSLDVLKSIDNKYDGFDLEYVLGRKKTFISTEAWTVNIQDGESVRTFDPYDQLFYHLPNNDEGKPLITNQADELRFDAFIKGINAELAFLSMKCGLGEGFFKFDGNSIATATQVISENSTLFRNIKKHEILLEQVLINLTKVVIKASNDFTSIQFSNFDENDIKILFDDSIFEDKNSEMERDRADVMAGIMSIPEYREKWYGEDEETAKEKYQDYFLYSIINNYLTALSSGAIRPEEYVEKVFPNAQNKEEIVEYIKEFVSAPSNDMQDYLYEGDETGGVKLDEQGNPITEEDDDMEEEPELDEEGNPIVKEEE